MSELYEWAALGVEAVGVLILLAGFLFSLGHYLYTQLASADKSSAYKTLRQELGRTLLLCLEFLVAADIIYTIAVEPSFKSLGLLGLLVLIRTFLSVSLEMELTGRWPWQHAETAPGDE